MIESFEELDVWKKARELNRAIFEITGKGNFANDYRFRDQLRAAAGSVMDNIAEGFERNGNREFIQFLYIAKGSCGESRSQLHRALDFLYITTEEFERISLQTKQISQSLSNFIKYLKNSDLKGDKYK